MKKSVPLFVSLLLLSFASITLAVPIEGVITWNPQEKKCSFHSGNASNPQENGLDPGDYMIWVANVPDGTMLEFAFFKKEVAGHWGNGDTPFADNQRFFNAVVARPANKVARGPVRAGLDNYFSYEITCKVPGEQPSIVDPMIDVPKTRISTQTQTTTTSN